MSDQSYDIAKSTKVTNDPKIKAYLMWLKQNGAIFDKVDFPAYFNGVCGARATADIEPREAFLFIPNKLIISVETARKSEIGEVFQSHDSLFVGNIQRDYFILVIFLLYEKSKGENSFWNLYF